MKYNKKPEVLWTKDYVILIIASCGISFTTQFFIPTLPIYAQKISNTAAYAGFMTGAYTLAAMAIRPLSGFAIDRLGRKKFLVLGAFMCGIACFSYNFAGTIAFLILLRMLNGIGFGIHSTTAGAVAADIIPKSRLMEGMGYFSLYGSISFALAPGIALSIIGDGQPEKFKALFLLAALVSLLSMILNSCITYERKKNRMIMHNKAGMENAGINENDNIISGEERLPKTFLGFEYAVFLPSFVVLLLYLGQSSVMSFLALYANEHTIGNIGLFFTLFATGMFLSRLVMGKIADRRGPDIILIPAMAILSLYYLLIPFIHSLKLLLLIAFPFGLSMGMVYPILYSLIIKRSSLYRRGGAAAAYFSAVDIGIGIGSISFGFIITVSGFTLMYFLSSVFTVLALGIYVFFLSKKTGNP